jgi:hypothetical protein
MGGAVVTSTDATNYTAVVKADQVTTEIFEAAESIFDGWYADVPRIDWDDFLDRLDGMSLEDGSTLDLGEDMMSPAIKTIKTHIRRYRQL